MADYRKMYYVLCKAIDDVIDPLEGIPLARPYAQKLQKALKHPKNLNRQILKKPKQSLKACSVIKVNGN